MHIRARHRVGSKRNVPSPPSRYEGLPSRTPTARQLRVTLRRSCAPASRPHSAALTRTIAPQRASVFQSVRLVWAPASAQITSQLHARARWIALAYMHRSGQRGRSSRRTALHSRDQVIAAGTVVRCSALAIVLPKKGCVGDVDHLGNRGAGETSKFFLVSKKKFFVLPFFYPPPVWSATTGVTI